MDEHREPEPASERLAVMLPLTPREAREVVRALGAGSGYVYSDDPLSRAIAKLRDIASR